MQSLYKWIPALTSKVSARMNTSLLSKLQLGWSGCSSSGSSSPSSGICSSPSSSGSSSSSHISSTCINFLPRSASKAGNKSGSDGLFELCPPEDSHNVPWLLVLEHHGEVVRLLGTGSSSQGQEGEEEHLSTHVVWRIVFF